MDVVKIFLINVIQNFEKKKKKEYTIIQLYNYIFIYEIIFIKILYLKTE